MKRGYTTAEVEAFYAANPGGRIEDRHPAPWYRSTWAVASVCVLAAVAVLIGLALAAG